MKIKIRWFFFTTRVGLSILLASFLFPGYTKKALKNRKIKNVGFEYIKIDNKGNIFFEENEWNKNGNIFLKTLLEKPLFINHLIDTCFKEGKNFLKFAKKISKNDWHKFSNKEIALLLLSLKNKFYRWGFWIVFPQTIDKFLENYLRKIIEKNIKDRSLEDEILGILIKPKIKIYTEEENFNLLKIALEIKEKKLKIFHPEIKRKIKNHLEKYSWTKTRWWQGEGLNEMEIIRRLNKIVKNIEILWENYLDKEKEEKKLFNLWIKRLNLDSKEKKIIDLTKKIVYLRTYRTDIVNWVGFLIRKFLEEIAQRLKITYYDLLNLGVDEIIKFLKKKDLLDLKEEIKKRKKEDWVYYVIYGRGRIIYQKIRGKKEKEIKEIKGSPAYLGKAKGRIKIVLNRTYFNKIRRGDILVTPMTTPDFIPILKKIKAIITDEGGITCHAAIISRELGIPCIIGTKIATRVLKDGDLVEVDAGSGIISIIKKSNS